MAGTGDYRRSRKFVRMYIRVQVRARLRIAQGRTKGCPRLHKICKKISYALMTRSATTREWREWSGGRASKLLAV